MSSLADAPFQVRLYLAGRAAPVTFDVELDEVVAFLVTYLADDARRGHLFPGTDAPAREILTTRFEIRWVFAIAYGHKIWNAGDEDAAASVWNGPSTWAIRARTVEQVEVVDPLDVPREPPRLPIGFTIEQGRTTS